MTAEQMSSGAVRAITAEQLAEVLDAGFNAARGHDEGLAAALNAMAQKAREVASREGEGN